VSVRLLELHTRATEAGAVVDCVPQYNVVTISCTAQGQAITGPWGTTRLWDRTSYANHTGFMTDAWVYTATANPVAHAAEARTTTP
jgi:hypothetical protein